MPTENQLVTLREILRNVHRLNEVDWVYAREGEWTLDTLAAVLSPDEVPPELEDEPDAGVPEFAKVHELAEALPVATVQDIVSNARAQKPSVTEEELLKAMRYYYSRDAFIEL